MKRMLFVLLLVSAASSRADNARSRRSDWQFTRYVIQQQNLNRQWARHFAALKRDQEEYRLTGSLQTRTGWMMYQRRLWQERWHQQIGITQQRAWRR